jgi:transposase
VRPVSSQPVVVISALTYTPRTDEFNLFFRMQQDNFENQSVRSFLLDLMTLLPRKPVVLLDNWSAHIKAVKILEEDEEIEIWEEEPTEDDEEADSEEAADETAPDGAVVFFPTYAPELNPTEYVWSQSKYAELANYTPKTTDVLQRRVGQSLVGISDKQDLLRKFVKDSELELEL